MSTSAPSLNRFCNSQVVSTTTQLSSKELLDYRKSAVMYLTRNPATPPIAFSDRSRKITTAQQLTTLKQARAIVGSTPGTSLYNQNVVEFAVLRASADC